MDYSTTQKGNAKRERDHPHMTSTSGGGGLALIIKCKSEAECRKGKEEVKNPKMLRTLYGDGPKEKIQVFLCYTLSISFFPSQKASLTISCLTKKALTVEI